jgi:D-aspartate ligase
MQIRGSSPQRLRTGAGRPGAMNNQMSCADVDLATRMEKSGDSRSFSGTAQSAANTPAVIVEADLCGLGVARSLGQAGVPIYFVDANARRPALRSRYVSGSMVTASSGSGVIDALLELQVKLNCRPMLFARTDEMVRTISKYRDRLAPAFHFRLPDDNCVCSLLHKRSFQQIAERYGFPIPRATAVCKEEDLANLAHMRFPVVIKPGDTKLYYSSCAPRVQTAARREEAEAACRAILPQAPDLIVQEWIAGGESDIYFCLQYRGENGATISSFTGRKLRCWPPLTGTTASATAAPEVEAILEPMTTEFFNKTGCVGFCSMEYKRDPRTGEFFMIEPTVGRVDWQEETATVNGVNIPLAAYRYELGFPLPAAKRPLKPVIWSYTPWCLRSMAAARSWSNSRLPHARVKGASWRLEDPLPAIFDCAQVVAKLFSLARWREIFRQHRVKGGNQAQETVPLVVNTSNQGILTN